VLILLLFAVLAGLVTVASPCILPILPIVLTASVAQGRARPLAVITGLVVSFSVFTLAVSQVVALLGISATVLRVAAVAIIGLLGLSMFVPALSERTEVLFSRVAGVTRPRAGPVTVSLLAPDVANASLEIGADARLDVSAARLYHLVRLPSAQEGVVELRFDRPGVRVYAFTFGS
jgi:cytochrome c biogenesis protein CcdA